ncbi:MAG: HisA/HisF-related TIM barrel protein [Pirellulaceae bacterium]|nr:HisA/HisF-related TIM barrel protein [Pirellulaceae bacterium]
MRVLPVIDLKGGQVVLGRAGQRELYQPVQSVLCRDASPAAISRAFQKLGLHQIYLADLDAIGGAEPDWDGYNQVAETGLALWIDAGIDTLDRAQAIVDWAAERELRLICGLESLRSSEDLDRMLAKFGADRMVVSLDLMQGQMRTSVPAWRSAPPLQVAGELIARGFSSLILLDVARVGIDAGTGTRPLCREIRRRNEGVEIICGGGVSHMTDLCGLAEDGCQFALLASALHDGRIGSAELQQFKATSS